MGFQPATLFAAASVVAELGGGLMLAVGLLTPAAVMALLGLSVVIIFKVHWTSGFFAMKGGFEYPMLLALAALSVGIAGPGTVSIDNAIGLQPTDPARAALMALGVIGGLVSVAMPRLFARTISAHAG